MTLNEITAEALKLEPDEREELVALILDSLDAADPNDSDEDSLTEAIRRGEELRSGSVEGIPMEEFVEEFRASRRK
jgi:putative addiction module component (TIGR02574 family)